MALVIQDRVLESSITTGVGAFALTGAVLGYRTFASVCAVADTLWYYIEGVDSFGKPSGEYEYGLGTYSAANTLTRTTVRGSSNGGAAVNFTTGAKLVGIGVLAPVSAPVKSEWLAALGAAPVGAYAASGTNTDISTTTNLGTLIYNGLYRIEFGPAYGAVAFGGTGFGAPGINLPPDVNLSFYENPGESLATFFRQAVNGSTILGSGVRWTATAGGFASSTNSNWNRYAVEVGYNGFKIWSAPLATVAPGTDVAMELEFVANNGGYRNSRVAGYLGVYPQYECRAWVNFNGTGTIAILASGNVASITDNGAGDYTINLASAMPDANYAVALSNVGLAPGDTRRNAVIAGTESTAPTTKTASALRINVGNPTSASLADNCCISVAIFR